MTEGDDVVYVQEGFSDRGGRANSREERSMAMEGGGGGGGGNEEGCGRRNGGQGVEGGVNKNGRMERLGKDEQGSSGDGLGGGGGRGIGRNGNGAGVIGTRGGGGNDGGCGSGTDACGGGSRSPSSIFLE